MMFLLIHWIIVRNSLSNFGIKMKMTLLEFFLISIFIGFIICKVLIMKLFMFVDIFFIKFIIYPFHIVSRMDIRYISKRIDM